MLAHLSAVVLLINVGTIVGTDCDHPTPVLAFEASFSASLRATLPPDTVNGLSVSGHEAGEDLFDVVVDILSERKVCAADRVAFAASRALALVKTLKPVTYFTAIGFNMGPFLYAKGKLTCDNAVVVALDFSNLVRQELKSLDLSKFKSLEYGVVSGIVNLLVKMGFSL